MNEVILKVKNLSVDFAGKDILQNISFEVRRGETLSIIGPNGAGKSVLLKTILGLFPYKGKITIEPNIRIGYVPQKIDIDKFTKLTVEEFFEIKRKILKLSKKDIQRIMGVVRIDKSMLSKQLNILSGGNLQRVFIAFALIGDPDIILLDEPTLNIDLAGEKQVHKTLHHVMQLQNTGLILVTHDLHMVGEHADRILGLSKKIIFAGKPEKILKPNVLSALFGVHHVRHHIGHKHEYEEGSYD